MKARRFSFPDLKAAGMAKIHPAFVEYQRKRFARPDAKLWANKGARHFKANCHQERIAAWLPRTLTVVASAQKGDGWTDSDHFHLRLHLLSVRGQLLTLKFQRLLHKAIHPGGGLDGPGSLTGVPHYLLQPRVPAGNPDGGQWTNENRTQSSGSEDSRVGSLKPAAPSSPGVVMSDASPDPIRPGAQYAAMISVDASALTGISTIDNATKKLANTLSNTLDVIDRVPGVSGHEYGTEVHLVFGLLVRLQAAFEGDNFSVETSFNDKSEVPYGSKGSARTDVILRNDSGDIIAIYDVKTGNARLSSARANYLRAKAGVGPNVPVIELRASRRVAIKGRSLPRRCSRFIWRS